MRLLELCRWWSFFLARCSISICMAITIDVSSWNSMVDEAARQRALQALRRKRSLKHQLRLYVIVNAILVLVWLGSGRGSFWPIYPIAFWGISLLIQGWSASHPDREFSEEEIAREMERS